MTTTRTGAMRWRRMPMEEEAPEQFGYEKIKANLAESSCRDRTFKDIGVALDDLVLLYGDHRGHPGARALLAEEAGLHEDDVLLCAGAAMALFVVHSVLLGPGDHLVVVRPNYATNLETPYALACDVTHIDLTFETGWVIDTDAIARALTPSTKLISVTTPHNPTGVEMSEASLRRLIALAEQHGCFLLVDQTYRDMTDGDPLVVAAGLSSKAITVSSVSKTYGVPGIREGWLLSSDRAFLTKCLAAKEQIVLTGSMVDEALCFEVLKKRAAWLPDVKRFLRAQRETVKQFIAHDPRFEWVEPTGGVTAFVRVRADVPFDGALFYRTLVEEHGTFVGPGHWFGQPARCMRIGWGWPTADELAHGLRALSASLDRCR
jgi:aspartate/methionine/tyrosine aminotransferase